jgi:hypothetical protein
MKPTVDHTDNIDISTDYGDIKLVSTSNGITSFRKRPHHIIKATSLHFICMFIITSHSGCIILPLYLVPHGIQNAKYQLIWNDEMQNAKIFMGVFSSIQNAKFF